MAATVGTQRSTDLPDPRFDGATSTNRPARSNRRLVPRTGLPGGRAALGGLLVALAALGLFVALTRGGDADQATYLVATHSLSQGIRLQRGDLALHEGALAPELRTRTFSRLEDAVGTVLLGPVEAGDPLLRHQVVRGADPRIPPQLSFAVAPERALGGDVRRGDHVRVLVTFGQAADAPTKVAASDVEVLDVHTAGNGSLGSTDTLVITVGVSNDTDAMAIARATTAGKITLVRLGPAPS